jgi:hypothetical protein
MEETGQHVAELNARDVRTAQPNPILRLEIRRQKRPLLNRV